jgi:molybdopterin synthase catalytic subunit
MTIRIQQQAFNPWEVLASHEQAARERLAGPTGGAAVFVGTMRESNQGQDVSAMTLEHYPGMTEAYLKKIREEAQQRWELVDALIVHRVGPLKPGEAIVLVACWAAHRDAAFAACRYLIDELKNRAPFWKQEQTDAGLRWVDKN